MQVSQLTEELRAVTGELLALAEQVRQEREGGSSAGPGRTEQADPSTDGVD
jgi:hypothetical protein